MAFWKRERRQWMQCNDQNARKTYWMVSLLYVFSCGSLAYLIDETATRRRQTSVESDVTNARVVLTCFSQTLHWNGFSVLGNFIVLLSALDMRDPRNLLVVLATSFNAFTGFCHKAKAKVSPKLYEFLPNSYHRSSRSFHFSCCCQQIWTRREISAICFLFFSLI